MSPPKEWGWLGRTPCLSPFFWKLGRRPCLSPFFWKLGRRPCLSPFFWNALIDLQDRHPRLRLIDLDHAVDLVRADVAGEIRRFHPQQETPGHARRNLDLAAAD